MRVLVVEDDRALGDFLKKGMEREGHQVDWVGDGEAALAYAEVQSPDLMVLDLSLPKLDGMDVLDRFRRLGADTSILVLTGRNHVDARVRCLDLGADDCLLKPFSFAELTARCRALVRRREQFSDAVLRHGDLHLNRVQRKVVRGGAPIELTTKEFALLEYLMAHRGQCVGRAELLEQVWQMPSTAGTNVVDVYINYLRRKLLGTAPAGAEHKEELIQTVRGVGYRLGGITGMQPRSVALPVGDVLYA